jgi:hypothetical protein
VRGSAAGAWLVSAKEGEGRSGLSAEGCGGLQALAGALAGGGVVGLEGDTLGRRRRVPVSRPRSGPERPRDRGGWTRDGRGVSSSTARSARSYGSGVIYSELGFPNFCPQGVRRNARMNFKFEFLKTSTVGCHHIEQGFQRYFCCAER